MVLVKWLAPRYHQRQSPVLASVKPVNQSMHKKSPDENQTQDGIFVNDPWANWNRPEGLQKPKFAADCSSHKPRVIEAPLEDRFKKISEDIVKNNETYDQKMQELQNQVQDLSNRFDTQDAHRQQYEESVKQEFAKVRSETTSQLQAMTRTFEQSLRSSLSKQDAQINSQFAELRNLLLQKPNPAKKAKATKSGEKEEDAEMSPASKNL